MGRRRSGMRRPFCQHAPAPLAQCDQPCIWSAWYIKPRRLGFFKQARQQQLDCDRQGIRQRPIPDRRVLPQKRQARLDDLAIGSAESIQM
jgi:hypothetical protein